MGFPTTEILGLIYQLLPGFMAAWIFYALTAHPIRSPFERTVQALIFTGFVKSVVVPLRFVAIWLGSGKCNLGPWSSDGEYVLSVAVGIVVGFVFTVFANTSWLHDRLPNWVTKKSSFATEWYSVFYKERRWIYLHLKDQRRIYGWPSQWPDSPTTGHFVLSFAKWVLDDNTFIPLLMTQQLLIPARDVVMVEMEKNDEELKDFDLAKHSEIVQTMIGVRKSAESKPGAQAIEKHPKKTKGKNRTND